MSATASPSRAWTSCGAPYVAVYGTLRAGGSNDIARLDPTMERIGVTTLTGTLYDLGWYPGLQLQGTQAVLAEVYPIHHALEQAMDRVEGIWPDDIGEYAKRVLRLPVQQAHGDECILNVLVYEALPRTVQGKPVLSERDWLAWYSRQHRQIPNDPFVLNTQRP